MGEKKYKSVKKSSGSKTNKPVRTSKKVKNIKLAQKYSKKSLKSDSDNSDSEPEIVSYKRTNKKKSQKYESDKSESESEIESEIESGSELDKYDNDNDFRNVIFENINDKYALGKFGDLEVVMMRENGFVNATNLCKKCGKDYKNWNQNSYSKELIKELIKQLSSGAKKRAREKSAAGFPAAEVTHTVKGGKLTIIRGTYVHPKLIIHIASWCSTEYAMKVSDIVTEYHAKEEVEKRELLLKKKDDKIDKLSKKLDTLIVNNKELMVNNKELLNNNQELLQKNEKMDNRIKRLVKKNDEIYNINQDMLGKIDVISNDRVVKGRSSDDHMFVIVKNNDDPNEYDEDEDIYEYSAFRLMKKSYKIRMSEHLERHPDMEIVLKISHSPNSMNLWNRIKTKLGKKKITYSGCNFNLDNDYTENKLVRDIKKIHNERLDTDDI
ncbi:KilA-N domain-containing protein [Megavirus baoshan]|uniref:KilA-N domain-containing protein n=1 Tax=Megavirus baoshan TaxID=2496520 RepID=A0A3S8UXZ0_9VIRU|nr:KilA-N domain-containing protein [Megavirus baoshan]AZL89569.1 KilA-N domain-containing protein [Megavirus baoshan]